MRRAVLAVVALGALALLGIATGRRERVPPRVLPRPNVVLVIGCTVRADQLSPWGAPSEVSPFLAERAGQGLRFTNALAQAPWTRPAVTALLTGRHAAEFNLTEPAAGLNQRALPEEAETLAERLLASGWHTVGVSANPNVSEHYGFDQGFERFESDVAGWRQREVAKLPGTEVVDRSLELLAEVDDGGPVFLQLLLTDAHLPDDTASWERARFESPGVLPRLAAYRARLRRLDDAIAHLHESLAERGITEENTLFVFVADHGEGLGIPEGVGHGHGRYLWPSVVQIPWLVWGTGVVGGRTEDALVQQLDLVPTVLGALGEPVPASLGGADLSDALRGVRVSGAEHVIVDTRFREVDRAAIYTTTSLCQRDFAEGGHGAMGGARLPAFEGGCFERQSLARIDPRKDLLEELSEWRRATEALAPPPTLAGSPSDEEASVLRALGYMEP